MTIPLIVLAVGATLAGFVALDAFVGAGREGFWRGAVLVLEGNDSIEAGHHVPLWVKLAPLVVAVAGIALAWLMYIRRPELPGLLAERLRPLYLFLLNKWYFDEFYDWAFVRPAHYLGRNLWKSGDGAVIDGVGPDGVAAVALNLARRASRLQTGYLYHYAFAMLIGVFLLATWYILAGLT
jgi:NADH-quinone oxidoreductase subunit L